MVTIAGKDHWLGRYGTPESRARYDQLIASWVAAGRPRRWEPPGSKGDVGLNVSTLIDRYEAHAEVHYRKAGEPTSQLALVKRDLERVRKLFGGTPADRFGPIALKTCRQQMVRDGISRKSVNSRVGRIRRMFRWGVENELLSPAVHQALMAVPGLQRGRTDARETAPVQPVPEDHINAVLPHLSRQVQAMVHLQLLTGMRPSDLQGNLRPRKIRLPSAIRDSRREHSGPRKSDVGLLSA